MRIIKSEEDAGFLVGMDRNAFSCIRLIPNSAYWEKERHFILFIYLFYFTTLYWFCHTLTWICHECTCVCHLEPPSHLPPHPISLGHPSAPAPSILYLASNLDWQFVSHMIIYMFQCHSPISSHPHPLPQSPKDFKASASVLLSHIQGYRYHLSKFHIYVLVYCIGVFLSGLLHSA